MKKLVLFGAGKIGRSFIGQLFSRSGYEVVFVEKDRILVDALNRYRSYRVVICDTNPETIQVEKVRGITVDDVDAIAAEIASADILAVSIGKNGLPHIVPVLAQGLLLREKLFPGRAIDLILAENMRNADQYMRQALAEILPTSFPLDERVGLVETSIGKMVPLIENHNTDGENLLTVYAESYNTLIVNKEAFINPIPQVQGLDARIDMKAWVDRKQFIHNFGHAATAYLGYLHHPEKAYLWEALEDTGLVCKVREAMAESAAVLQTLYPGVFTDEHLTMHADDLLRRFANRSLGDTVFRVGCDLYRKLSPDDRIVTPLNCARRSGLPYGKIASVLQAALHFKAKDAAGMMFPDDIRFHEEMERKGAEMMLKEVCGLNEMITSEIINNKN